MRNACTNHTSIILLIAIFILGGCASAPAAQQSVATNAPGTRSTSATQSPPAFGATSIHHIFYIMMENHGYNEIIGNTADAPYLNYLAKTYGTARHYYGITHPSLPNYLSAISGSFQGIWDDCNPGSDVTCEPEAFNSSLTNAQYSNAANQPHLFNGQTIVDQLEAHQLTWKAYMQSLPSTDAASDNYNNYAVRHDPFVYFANIQNNSARMQRIVPFTALSQDLQSGSVPNFAWISPDVCNDMHGTDSCSSYDSLIKQGDTFIHSTVQEIMSSAAWKEGAAIAITWDESGDNTGCCGSPTGTGGTILGGGNVPLIVISSTNSRHSVLSTGSYNHYSLLATIESLWNLGCLAQSCNIQKSALLTSLFQ